MLIGNKQGQGAIHLRHRKGFWTIVSTNPLPHRHVVRIKGIAPSGLEPGESTYPSTIFRRTGPTPINTGGIWRFIFRSQLDAFNKNLMLPGVAKIIFVDEGSPYFGSNLSEVHVLLIFMKGVILRARLTVGGDFLPILHQKL